MGAIKNIKNLNILTNSETITRFGIDYLRFNFDKRVAYLDNILDKLDFDNSNFLIDENEFMYVKTNLSTGKSLMISTVYDGQAIPFAMYNVFQHGTVSKYARLDFYGSYFRLEEVGFFHLGFYKDFISEITTENPTISRIDYCVDLFYEDSKLLPTSQGLFGKFDKTRYKIYSFSKGGLDHSWAIGSKSAKRCIIRMYDKLEDIGVKGKFNLYADYLKYPSVHRFEVQFGPSFTRGYTLLDLEALTLKVTGLFGINQLIHNSTLFYEYRNDKVITDYNKLYYTKQFVARANKFFQSGINPFLVLSKHFDGICIDKIDSLTYKKYLYEAYLSFREHPLLLDTIQY